MALRTVLYEEHLAAGGKMVEFAGYELPVEYKNGVVAEHLAVRQGAGLFDVSHMGEFLVSGPGALAWLNRLLTNSFDNLRIGRVRYSVMCNPEGGCLDDLIVYRTAEEEYLIVVNAANLESDYAWMEKHLTEGVHLEDQSAETCLLALQGPASQTVLQKLTDSKLPEKYYSFSDAVELAGKPCRVARTGYTGEHGYEIFLTDKEQTIRLWQELLQVQDEAGKAMVEPCGLGARDTLRLEAGMPLYGHELSETISPLEAGLAFAVKTEKDFIGRDAIVAALPLTRKRVGLRALAKGIVREDAELFADDRQVGKTSSGTYAPYLEEAIAMALVEAEYSEPGTKLTAQVRKRKIEMEVVELPFYKANK